jgi:hypothetical protein
MGVYQYRLCSGLHSAAELAYRQLPIGSSPVPRRLIQVVKDIPELGEVACTPTCIHGAGRERRLSEVHHRCCVEGEQLAYDEPTHNGDL